MLASAILVGGLGALTRGFTNWDPDTWLDQWQTEDPNDSEDPNGSEEDTKVEGEKVEMLMKGGPKFASRSAINDTKTVTATIKNADAAMDKRIKWESSDSTKISVGKATTNSGESNTVKLVKYFSDTVTIYAYPYLGDAGDGATIEVTYENLVQSLSFAGVFYDDDGDTVGHLDLVVDDPSFYSYFNGASQDPSEVSFNIASKTSIAGEDYFIYLDRRDEIPAISGYEKDADPKSTLYAVFRGAGREGCESLQVEGLGSLDGEPIEGDIAYVDVSGNGCYAVVPVMMLKQVVPTIAATKTYSLGDAQINYRILDFVHASGVDVSENAIVF